MGVRGALRIATYGLWKARLDKRYLKDRPTGPELRPGSKGEIELGGDLTRIRDEIVSATSARIPFGELSLEVVFLNLAMVRLTWTPGRLPVSSAHDDTTPTEVQPFEASEDGDTTVLESGVTRVRVARDGSVVIEARPSGDRRGGGRGRLARRLATDPSAATAGPGRRDLDGNGRARARRPGPRPGGAGRAAELATRDLRAVEHRAVRAATALRPIPSTSPSLSTWSWGLDAGTSASGRTPTTAPS